MTYKVGVLLIKKLQEVPPRLLWETVGVSDPIPLPAVPRLEMTGDSP